MAGTKEAFQWAIVVNAVTYAATGAAVSRVRIPARVDDSPEKEAPAPSAESPRSTRRPRTALRDGRFLAVTGLNAVLLLHSSMIAVGLPLWISHRTHGPLWLVSAVVVLNTVGVVLLQMPLTKKVDSVTAACTAARRAAVCLALACLALAATSERGGTLVLVLILVAAVLHLGGEMLQAAASWTYAMDLAPEHAYGQYQGVFNAGLDITMLIAPAIYSWIVITPGGWGWLGLTMLFGASALAFQPVTRWALDRQGLGAA